MDKFRKPNNSSDVDALSQAQKHELLVMTAGHELLLKELGLYLVQGESNH
jgi:hypothetical protein